MLIGNQSASTGASDQVMAEDTYFILLSIIFSIIEMIYINLLLEGKI